MKKLSLILILLVIFSCGESTKKNKIESKEEYNDLKDCHSACDCADKLVIIAEEIREVRKKLWEDNLTIEQAKDIEEEVEKLGKERMYKDLGRILQKYEKEINNCESLKGMKGNITVSGSDDGDSTEAYYYDGMIQECNTTGNKRYFKHDGTLVKRIANKLPILEENHPYKLSKGIIDDKLFSFLASNNFVSTGIQDLQEMIKENNITLDSTIIEDLNDFPGCGCCDWDAFWNEDILYFKDGKVLIVEKHYDGDWESSYADWYDFYLYDENKRKFVKELTLDTFEGFQYNRKTGYIIDATMNPCGWETYYIIYNDKFKPVYEFGEDDIGYYESPLPYIDYYWNEANNEIILKIDSENYLRVYKNSTNNKWEIQKMDVEF